MEGVRAKKCFKCNQVKTLDEFYRHSAMTDGHLNKCKECTKRDVLEHRLLHLERIREYDRKRGARRTRAMDRAWWANNKEKGAAHNKLMRAVRAGEVQRPNKCSICGSSRFRIHGHHSDYTKPLDVIWCCPACHKQLHKQEV